MGKFIYNIATIEMVAWLKIICCLDLKIEATTDSFEMNYLNKFYRRFHLYNRTDWFLQIFIQNIFLLSSWISPMYPWSSDRKGLLNTKVTKVVTVIIYPVSCSSAGSNFRFYSIVKHLQGLQEVYGVFVFYSRLMSKNQIVWARDQTYSA